MKLYHPDLDATVERNPRQAEVLARSGWVPADPAPDPDSEQESDPNPDNQEE